jgi:protocatechuate 3,4-dioxygenase alpha subunit
VGPFFHYALPWKGGADLVAGAGELGARMDLIPDGRYLLGPAASDRAPCAGEVIEVFGRVLDGEGQPVPDALLEVWQANAHGRYAGEADPRADLPLDPGFTGFGRAATGADGGYRIRTVKPGRVAGPGNSLQAPHIAVGVLGRGLIKRLVTRIYFEGEPSNAEDPILGLTPAHRRGTLLARREAEGWRFDIRLQGEAETVFFAL